ncbi:MAG: MerR family transcriptional regulator [Massiliimalia sp.]|jgi:DNA-binding transcriptional MerR regulator
MKIKELCEKTGLTPRAVRLYEEKGLFFPEKQNRNGRIHREYTAEDERRLRQICILRKFRFSLEEIKTMINSPEQVSTVWENHLTQMRNEAEQLQKELSSFQAVHPQQQNRLEQITDTLARFEFVSRLPLEQADHFGKGKEDCEDAALGENQNFWHKMERKNRWKQYLLGALLAIVLAVGISFLGLMATSRSREIRSMGFEPGNCQVWKEYKDFNGNTSQVIQVIDGDTAALLLLSRNSWGFWSGYASQKASKGETASLLVTSDTVFQLYQDSSETESNPEIQFVYQLFVIGTGTEKKVTWKQPLPSGVYGAIHQGQETFLAEFQYTDDSFSASQAEEYLHY